MALGERPESVMEIITKKVKSLGPGHIPIVDEHLDSDETDESDCKYRSNRARNANLGTIIDF